MRCELVARLWRADRDLHELGLPRGCPYVKRGTYFQQSLTITVGGVVLAGSLLYQESSRCISSPCPPTPPKRRPLMMMQKSCSSE